MTKYIIILLALTILNGCADDYKRIEDCKKKFPNCRVTPSTGLIQRQGYEVTVFDTLKNQMYAVSYYPFSETKICNLRNIY